ncbi:DUF523 domain-containing protein [bacterium]|nr:DUF523 domain-containing protein [bacterium]
MRKKVLLSACLAGLETTYKNDSNFHPAFIELIKNHQVILACPEQLGGLSTPRTPAEIVGDKVFDKNGKDVTENFSKGANETLRVAQMFDIDIAIMTSHSPSCGKGLIHDGNFKGDLTVGNGVTVALLKKHGFEVITDKEFIEKPF